MKRDLMTNNRCFLHDNWRKSREYQLHKAACRKAEAAGLPRPRIPPHIREKFTTDMVTLTTPVPYTKHQVEPATDDLGAVLVNKYGDIKWKPVRSRMSRQGVHENILALYVNNDVYIQEQQ